MRLTELTQADTKAKTLYVSRPLKNAEAVIAWATAQGFEKCLPKSEFHVTVAYSKKKVNWDDTTPMKDTLRIKGGPRKVMRLGDKGAVVLHFESPDLQERWEDLTENVGCSWDYPSYECHVTITYDGANMDLSNVEPFDGDLVFGPEEFKELNENYLNSVKETPLDEAQMRLGAGLDPHQAYELFRQSYERETGSSWSEEKFLARARGWIFFGDQNGFVCLRQQASGPMKLVGVAGDPRSVMKGLDEVKSLGGPIWGAVSAPLAKMAQKRGMIAPHTLPGGAMLLRTLIKTIPASVFGGTTPEVMKDGGLAFDYDDTGHAEKYLIGNKAYFAHALGLPQVVDALKNNPAIHGTVKLLSRLTGIKSRE